MVAKSKHFQAKMVDDKIKDIDSWYDETRNVLLVEIPIKDIKKDRVIFIRSLIK